MSKTTNGEDIIALEEHGYYIEVRHDHQGWGLKINDWNTPKRGRTTPWKILEHYSKLETSSIAKAIRDSLKGIYGNYWRDGMNRILQLMELYEDRWEKDLTGAPTPSSSDGQNISDLIVESVLGDGVQLFCDQYNEPHILIHSQNEEDTNAANANNANSVPSSTPRENTSDIYTRGGVNNTTDLRYLRICVSHVVKKVYNLSSTMIKEYISGLMWKKHNTTVKAENINSAISVLKNMARDNDLKRLFNRVGEDEEGKWWLDLSNLGWEAVKITDDGWEIVEEPPVIFRRYSHQLSLVYPEKGGKAYDLLKYIHLTDVDNQLLWLVTQISYLIPSIPHPISILWGGKGTVKSTAQQLVKNLIDNSGVGLLHMPGKYKDNELIQNLDHHYISGFDNLTTLEESQSDILCRAVTGAGISKRMLYTDDEDVTRRFMRCVTINGINIPGDKPDLLDRSIIHETNPIPRAARKPIKYINADFWSKAPRILGGMLDVIVEARNIVNDIEGVKDNLNRMADFTLWGCAITEALGLDHDKFLIAYNENIADQERETIRASKIGPILIEYLETQLNHIDKTAIRVTPAGFYEAVRTHAELNKYSTKKDDFPQGARGMSQELNKILPNLPSYGFNVKKHHDGKKRYLIFTKLKVTKLTDVMETMEKQTYNLWNGNDLRKILDGIEKTPVKPEGVQEHLKINPILSEKIREILEVINSIKQISEDGRVKEDALIDVLEPMGYEEEEVKKILVLLKRDNTIFNPSPGWIGVS